MKKIFTLFTLSFLVISCSESLPYETEVVEKISRNLKNPDSFQLDSILYDPYTVSDEMYASYLSDSSLIVDYHQEWFCGYKKIGHGKDMFISAVPRAVHQCSAECMASGICPVYTQSNTTTTLESERFRNDPFNKGIYDSLKLRNPQDLVQYKKFHNSQEDTVLIHRYKVYFKAQNSFGAIERQMFSASYRVGGEIEIEPENL